MPLLQRLRLLLAASCALVLLHATSVWAATVPYDQGTYGSCTYAKCVKHTTVVTPSGLKVAVNLTDGQILPRSGYDIVITPLNGQGSSFVSADILIDGQKQATIKPAADGTATWHWDTTSLPGGKVTINVLDSSDKTTTLDFNVTIADELSVPITIGSTHHNSGGGTEQASPGLPQKIVDGLKDIIRKLPPSVVRSFPYILFGLIVLEVAVLLLQVRRELKELRTVRALSERERRLNELKRSFTGLVSHNLRTPLTVLEGGIETYREEKPSELNGQVLEAKLQQLHQTINGVISVMKADEPAAAHVAGDSRVSAISLRRRLAVWVPVGLVGLLAAIFVLLARSVDRYDASTVNTLVQVLVFALLAVVVYQLLRRWQLHRQDIHAAREVLERETAVQTARDEVIMATATQLAATKRELADLVAKLPQNSAGATFIRDGFMRMRTIIDKLVIASRLKGSSSEAMPQPLRLQTLCEQAEVPVQPAADAKHVKMMLMNDEPLQSRDNGLLTLVLRSLLDNAVAYSQDSGIVEVSAEVGKLATAVHVTDHGSGITPDKLNTLFQPFSRVEDIERFDHDGLGFSLYLDKLIMAYLGGDIMGESVPREATTFTLTLPNV